MNQSIYIYEWETRDNHRAFIRFRWGCGYRYRHKWNFGPQRDWKLVGEKNNNIKRKTLLRDII